MAKVTITLEDREDDSVGIKVLFTPVRGEFDESTPAQDMADIMLETAELHSSEWEKEVIPSDEADDPYADLRRDF